MVISAKLEAQASAENCCEPPASSAGEETASPCPATHCLTSLTKASGKTLAVGKPVEQHVQDAQDLREVDLARHLFIRQVEAA